MSSPGPSTSALGAEGQCERGEDGGGKKRKLQSSSDDSSDDSSSMSSSSDERRKRAKRRKRNKRKKSDKYDRLEREMNMIKKYIFSRDQGSQGDNIDLDVSGEMYEQQSEHEESHQKIKVVVATKVKEPSVPRTSPEMLESLKTFQRFNREDWSEVRYADVQKLYTSSPGFVNLEANDEVRRFDGSKHICNAEKAYASITFALFKQRDALQAEMEKLMNWAHQNGTVDYKDLFEKVSAIFSESEYCKTTADAFQIVCGHRAELVQQRRETILSSVKDQHHKLALRKIPPSCNHLFDADKFSSVLDKAGGMNKVFWPKGGKDRYNATHNDKMPGNSNNKGKTPAKTAYKPANGYENFRGKGYRKDKQYKNAGTKSSSSYRDRRGPNDNKRKK